MGGGEVQLTGPDLKKGIPLSSIEPGQKILGHADGVPVLLVREAEQVFAVGALCSHYGGNLNDGIIVDGSVRCPWHHACFDLSTGEAKKAPALSPIATWQTEIIDGMIYVRGQRVSKEPEKFDTTQEHFVIVGSGAAGHAAAEMLRREGFKGLLTILSEDEDLPYDRPNLSKDYLAGHAPEEWIPLRTQDYYDSKEINFRLKTKVLDLDIVSKSLILSNGESVRFHKCLLATGGSPIQPKIPGIDQPHVHFLRTLSDCRKLIAGLGKVKKVAIVGSGFIGLESAAALKARGLDVVVISQGSIPLAHVVGDEMGAFLKSVHEKNGVRFILGETVTGIEKEQIILSNGERESADLVLVAVGIRPNTQLAERAGLRCENGILVNEYFETNAPNIFAVGDVARWPDPRAGEPIRVEHWAVAQRHGQAAALNMLGKNKKFLDVPFFWSQQFDVGFSYVGYSSGWTKSKVYGQVEKQDCAVAFYKNDKIVAVLTQGRDMQSLRIEKAFENLDQKAVHQILNETT